MKIGLFFGSFNPIHVGHLIIAQTMATSTDLQKVWFIVSPQNPFKKSKSLLHEFDRLDMVERAISDNPLLSASDLEFHMPKPSYTIDTLARIQDKFSSHEFRLIIGEDNLAQFPNWKNHEKILEYTGLLVYPRPGAKPHNFHDHPQVEFVKAPLIDLSATYIRQAVAAGRSIRYLVPEEVEEQIRIKKFYL